MAPEHRHVVERDDVSLSLIEWTPQSSLPPCLLLHATGFCAGTWRQVARRLSMTHHVFALDLRGHGQSIPLADPTNVAWSSIAADIDATARYIARHTASATLLGVGNSLGATTLLTACAERDTPFTRALLLDPVPVLGVASSGSSTLADGARRRRAHFATREAALEAWRQRSLFRRFDPQTLADYVADGLRDGDDGEAGVTLACTPEVEANIFIRSAEHDVRAYLSQVAPEAVIAWARRGSFPRVLNEDFVRALPNGQLEDVDWGHLAPMEEPERVAQWIVERDMTRTD